MENNNHVAAIVVTFNKVAFLKKNLISLLKQSNVPQKIIVVDNASSDETSTFMQEFANQEPRINYQRLSSNIGGAGGFNYGIKTALEDSDVEYFWLMDDDTMPTVTCLDELLQTSNRLDQQFGFLVSNARWTDGSAARMNVPETNNHWSDFLNEGLVGIKTGTFVSFFTSRRVVLEVGLPIKEFFIWSDDVEFSLRISNKYPSFLVGSSIVIHEMAKNQSVQFLEETDSGRLPRYFYSFRNKLFIERKSGKKGFVRYSLSLIILLCSLPFKNIQLKSRKEKVLWKGLWAGWRFQPQIEFYHSK